MRGSDTCENDLLTVCASAVVLRVVGESRQICKALIAPNIDFFAVGVLGFVADGKITGCSFTLDQCAGGFVVILTRQLCVNCKRKSGDSAGDSVRTFR